MPADANIFQQYLKAPKSIMDYQADMDVAETRKNALQLAAMDLSEKTQATQRAQQVRSAITGLGATASDDQRIAALRATGTPEGFTQADALEKGLLERQKTAATVKQSEATAGHLTAQTADQVYKTRIAKSDQAIKDISGFGSPQEALSSLEQHAAAGDIPPEQAQILRQQLSTLNPADFPRWQLGMVKNIMSAKDRMEYTAPNANTVANNATSRDNNAATNATHVQTANIAASTSRQNNSATIQKDYNIAGIDPKGGGATQDLRQMAQAIADGKLQPPTGMALNHPRMQLLMNEVMKINPNFDATSYGAKAKAARDFSSGNQGNAMRSFQVAGQHLDQLGQLVDALGNGNMQIINKVGNMYATQTGNPAPTNFDAAKDVVSKEVVKAIVAGGGGVAERQELSHLMDQAKSPAQLKGVIQQYRNLMAAQHDALLQQRDAAGLPRSTLPNYNEPGGGGTAGTAGWSVIGVQPAGGK